MQSMACELLTSWGEIGVYNTQVAHIVQKTLGSAINKEKVIVKASGALRPGRVIGLRKNPSAIKSQFLVETVAISAK